MRLLLLLLLFTLPVLAEDQVITTNGAQTKIVLSDKSEDLRVTGNTNQLKVSGTGDTLHVIGNGNQLEVDATLDSINVMGSQNKIKFVLKPGRPKPDFTNLGQGNTLDFIQP